MMLPSWQSHCESSSGSFQITYGALFVDFFFAAKTHLKKFDAIQRKAADIIYEVPRDVHADILLLFLKLHDLRDRREAYLISSQAHQVIFNRKMSSSSPFNGGSSL